MAGPGAGEWAKGDVDWNAHEPLNIGAGNLFKTFPGRRCILVAHEGRLVYEHYAPGAGPWEQIELDSAAKTVSALLIGVLVTQGRLELDRPLAHYNVKPAAYWGEHQEYWPLITARHLLTHTSGLGKVPPGTQFEYNSGEHIQHLSLLIGALTRSTHATPVDWAEESFAKPMGLPGLFLHDGLDGEISIGGGQLMSCPQLARIGQLLVNRGKWPVSAAPSWPLDLLPWATNRTSLFQLVSEDYITEMTRPSFPEVVSTYGFLLWLNHATGSDDSSCCMCTCGACFGVPSPPIFGINEEAWFATGFLTRYLIVLPQRNAFVVSLGMDLTGSTPCAVTWSWFSLTYDDSFGALLHYLVIQAALPIPDSTTTQTVTSSTTTRTLTTYTTTSQTTETAVKDTTEAPTTTTTTTTTTTMTTTAADTAEGWSPLSWLWPTTTTTDGWWPFELMQTSGEFSNESSGEKDKLTAASASSATSDSTTSTTTFDLSTVIYNHGTKSNLTQRKKRKEKKKRKEAEDEDDQAEPSRYIGGSCTCSCPIDQDFGRCYPLPDMVFERWHYGQEACDLLGSKYLSTEQSCPNVGIVQPCESNSWAIGGSTHNVCGRNFWHQDIGVNCTQLTFCERSEGHPIWVDTRKLATCSCNVLWWKCTYDSEPCDANDTYYTLGPSELAKDLLRDWSPPLQKHTSNASGIFSRVALVVLLALAIRAVVRQSWATRNATRNATDYEQMTEDSAT